MTIINLFNKKLDFYRSIDDLPIYNWFKIHENNDIAWLLKQIHAIDDRQKKTLEKAFEIIYDEYLDTFGIPEQMVKLYELQRDIAVLEIDMYRTGDRSLQTFIDIKKLELEQLLKQPKEKNNIYEVKSYVQKYFNRNIDPKTTTVREFYTDYHIMKREIEKTPKNG